MNESSKVALSVLSASYNTINWEFRMSGNTGKIMMYQYTILTTSLFFSGLKTYIMDQRESRQMA